MDSLHQSPFGRTVGVGGLLLIAGVLTLVPWIGLFVTGAPQLNPATNPGGVARLVTGPTHFIVGNIYIIGLLFLLFGVLAINARVASTSGGTWVGVGLVLAIVAITLVIGVWIVLTYVDAVIGDAYQGGNHGVGPLFSSMSGGRWSLWFVPLFVVGGLSGLVAAVALGTGLWRSGSFGKGMAIAFGLAFALSIVSAPIFSIVGALMLIVVGIVIARSG